MGESFSLDHEIDLALSNPGFYTGGGDLSPEERSVIKPGDVWEIALINRLSLDDKIRIGNCFIPLDLKHYTDLQVQEWFGTEFWLLGTQVGHKPDELAVILDANRHQNMERFRLCYALNFPHKTQFFTNAYSRYRDCADAFLALAERLHPERYPYFEVIGGNILLVAA